MRLPSVSDFFRLSSRRGERAVRLAAVALVLVATCPPATAGGGRPCACLGSLMHLDPAQVPAELRLDVVSPEVIAAFDAGDRPITAIQFLGFGGDTLAVAEFGPPRPGAGGPGRLLLYDLTGTAPRQKATLEASGDMVVGLAASPRTGELLVAGGGRWDQAVKLWRQNGKSWDEAKSVPTTSGGWWPRALAFSPDEKLLATASGNKAGPVQLWNVARDGKSVEPARVLPGPAWGVSALAFSPDGRFLVAGLGSQHNHPSDGQLLVWDLSASPPKLVHQATGLDERHANEPRDITSLAFLDRGRTLVSGDQHGMLRTWRVNEKGGLEPVAKIEAHQRGVRSIAAGPGGEVLSTGNDGCLCVWKPGENKLRRVALGEGGTVMALAPSGRHIAVGRSDGAVYVMRLGSS